MNLQTAISRIAKSFSKLDAAFGRPLFDELAIVSLAGGAFKILYYKGRNKSEFMAEFAENTLLLRKELSEDQTALGGEFSFTRDGEGANMDAYICLGPDAYLFCNHTHSTMEEITKDPRWLDAQGEFFNLSQYFAVDPLDLDEDQDDGSILPMTPVG